MNHSLPHTFEPGTFQSVPAIEAVVIVPGKWGGPAQFADYCAELQKLGYRAETVDTPSQDPTATFEDFVRTTGEVVCQYANVCLVGYSRGSLIAAEAANRWPQTVRRLQIINGKMPATADELDEHEEYGAESAWSVQIGPQIKAEHYEEVHNMMLNRHTQAEAETSFGKFRAHHALDAQTAKPLHKKVRQPVDVVQSIFDNMRDVVLTKRQAAERFGVNTVDMLADHTPQTEQAHFLALVTQQIISAEPSYIRPKVQAPAEALCP